MLVLSYKWNLTGQTSFIRKKEITRKRNSLSFQTQLVPLKGWRRQKRVPCEKKLTVLTMKSLIYLNGSWNTLIPSSLMKVYALSFFKRFFTFNRWRPLLIFMLDFITFTCCEKSTKYYWETEKLTLFKKKNGKNLNNWNKRVFSCYLHPDCVRTLIVALKVKGWNNRIRLKQEYVSFYLFVINISVFPNG